MKIVKRQGNSRMCIICGLDNESGVKAIFYEMEDKSVCSLFSFKEHHQSYPLRVHGGMITAMLDELGFRAIWPYEPNAWGVTISLETKYRRPVPYDTELRGYGSITKLTSKFVESDAKIYDLDGNVLAEAKIKYIKQSMDKIASDVDIHEEMCYIEAADREEIIY